MNEPTTIQDGRLMDIDAAAKYLNISRHTVHKKMAEGSISYIELGRKWLTTKEAIEVWLSSAGLASEPEGVPGPFDERPTKSTKAQRRTKR